MPNAQQNQNQSRQKASPANQNKSGKARFDIDKAKPIPEKNAMLDNEKLIRKLYTYGDGQGLDTEKFVSMFSDEGYMLDMASGTKFRGKAIGGSIAGLARAFPDVHRELLSISVAENTVVVEIAIRGTHKGELTLASGTLAPTGKAIDVPCCDVYHLKNGKIVAFNCYNLPSAMLRQLGVKDMRLS
jgi:ketosteroid isomerase-like protein